jgi:alpha-beta hydrolase superfamily lysophospholipase
LICLANGSLAADLANRGLRVFIMDVRGFGASRRPAREVRTLQYFRSEDPDERGNFLFAEH